MFSEEKYFDTEKLVDEVLKTQPQFILSENFADVVAEKMSRKYAWKQYVVEFLIYFGAIVGLITVSVAIQFVWFGAQLNEWMQFAASNIFWISGILILMLFILFADKVLLRYFFTGRQKKSISLFFLIPKKNNVANLRLFTNFHLVAFIKRSEFNAINLRNVMHGFVFLNPMC